MTHDHPIRSVRPSEPERRSVAAGSSVPATARGGARSDALANVSHEIRTPMNAIVGLTHLLGQTDLSAQQHDYLHKIQQAAQALRGVLDGILDLARSEAGALAVDSIGFDLLDVLDELAGPLGAQARAKGLGFEVSVGDGLPFFLQGDPARLGQVLLSLGGNAVKFTAQGRVTIAVTEVPGARRERSTRLRFTVADTGIGLAPGQAEELFQAFRQADASRTRQYGGTGLGLTVARRLVELMGGEIGVDAAPGRGASFWFTVPLGLAPAASAVEPDAAPAARRSRLVNAAPVAPPGAGGDGGPLPLRTLEIFNRDEGLDRIRNEEKFVELCTQFFAQHRDRLGELPALVDRGVRKEAVALAHALAGAAGLLGFERLAGAARELERRLRASGAGAGAGDLTPVLDAYAEAEAAFLGAGTATADDAAPPPATGEVTPLLDELDQQIGDFDIQAFDTFRHLRRSLGGAHRLLLAPLEAQLKDFDFAGAAGSLAQLRAALVG